MVESRRHREREGARRRLPVSGEHPHSRIRFDSRVQRHARRGVTGKPGSLTASRRMYKAAMAEGSDQDSETVRRIRRRHGALASAGVESPPGHAPVAEARKPSGLAKIKGEEAMKTRLVSSSFGRS